MQLLNRTREAVKLAQILDLAFVRYKCIPGKKIENRPEFPCYSSGLPSRSDLEFGRAFLFYWSD